MTSIAVIADDEGLSAPPIHRTTTPLVLLQPLPTSVLVAQRSDATPGFLSQARDLANRYPHVPTSWSRLARAEWDAGHQEAAIEAANRVFDLTGDLGPVDEASLVAATQVLLVAGVRSDVDARLGRLLAQARDGIATSALDYLYANLAAREGKYRMALARLERVDADQWEAASLRGWLLIKESKYAEAVRVLRHALDSGYASADLFVNLGYAYATLGSFRKAYRSYSAAVSIDPSNRTASLNLVAVLFMRQEYDKAARVLKRLSQYHPNDLQLDFHVAQCELSLGNVSKAIAMCQEARAHKYFKAHAQTRAEFDVNMAVIELGAGKITGEIALGRALAAIKKSDFSSLDIARWLTFLAERPSQVAELKAAFDELAKRHPAADLLGLRTRIAGLQGRYEEAADLAIEWLEREPLERGAGLEATHLLGTALLQFDRAIDVGLILYRRIPTDPFVANNLAFALAMNGRTAEARRILPSRETFPLGGPTAALIELAAGNTDLGLAMYREAEEYAASRSVLEGFLTGCYRKLAQTWFGIGDEAKATKVPTEAIDSIRYAVVREGLKRAKLTGAISGPGTRTGDRREPAHRTRRPQAGA